MLTAQVLGVSCSDLQPEPLKGAGWYESQRLGKARTHQPSGTMAHNSRAIDI